MVGNGVSGLPGAQLDGGRVVVGPGVAGWGVPGAQLAGGLVVVGNGVSGLPGAQLEGGFVLVGGGVTASIIKCCGSSISMI